MSTPDTDIGSRIDAMNPDTFNWNDASAYMALGIGEGDEPLVEDDSEGVIETGDNATAPAPAAAPAAAPAPQAAPAAQPAADPAGAPASSASPSAAGESTNDPAPVEGIATADGKRVIPYAVLQATRRQATELKAELDRANARLQEALTKSAGKPGDNDLAARAAADPDSLTEQELEALAADFPAMAKPMQQLRKLQAKVDAIAAAPAPAAPAAAPAAPAAGGPTDEEQFDEGIAANPVLAGWMGSGGKEWQRAVAIDKLLSQDADYQALTYAKRFAKVQRMVAAEFDIALSKPAPTPTPTPTPTAAPAAAAAPALQARASAYPSLSDMGGSTPKVGFENELEAMTTTDALARAERMSEAELMRLAGVSY